MNEQVCRLMLRVIRCMDSSIMTLPGNIQRGCRLHEQDRLHDLAHERYREVRTVHALIITQESYAIDVQCLRVDDPLPRRHDQRVRAERSEAPGSHQASRGARRQAGRGLVESSYPSVFMFCEIDEVRLTHEALALRRET